MYRYVEFNVPCAQNSVALDRGVQGKGRGENNQERGALVVCACEGRVRLIIMIVMEAPASRDSNPGRLLGFNFEGVDSSQPAFNHEIRPRSAPWDVPLPESHLQPLRNRLDEEKLHVIPDFSWNIVVHILPVRPREYNLLHTHSVRSQHLLFDPAHRFDATAEGDLGISADVRNHADTWC